MVGSKFMSSGQGEAEETKLKFIYQCTVIRSVQVQGRKRQNRAHSGKANGNWRQTQGISVLSCTGQFGSRLLFQSRGLEVWHVHLEEGEGCGKDKRETQGLWALGGKKRWCVKKALWALAHPGMSSCLEYSPV